MSEPENNDFTDFLAAVKNHTGPVDETTVTAWRQRFDSLWTNESDQWCALVELLPLPENGWPRLSEMNKLILEDMPESMLARITFLATVGYKHLSSRYWTDQIDSPALKFVAGCINLIHATALPQEGLPAIPLDFPEYLQQALLSYPRTLAAMNAAHVREVRLDAEGFKIGSAVSINFRHFRCRWPTEQEIVKIVKTDTDLDSHENAFLKITSTDNLEVSTAFLNRLGREVNYRFENEMRLWAFFLTPAQAFDYCWRFLTTTHGEHHRGEESHFFGKTVDERITNLRQALLDSIDNRESHFPDWPSSLAWREAFIKLFRPVASLLVLERSYRRESRHIEEAWARQDEAIEVVSHHPQLVPLVVRGVLDYGESSWDLFDPIVLGLPQEAVLTVLEDYMGEEHSHNSHYHARLLLSHVRGDKPQPVPHGSGNDAGILGAVENLIAASRTHLPHDQSQIWLGDVAIESLWLGAMEAATKEFAAQFDSQFGQDEHEHVAVLADALARHLNATNATVNVWLDHRRAIPAFLNVSVRRFPKTAKKPLPQEGGRSGVQADLAILMTCEIPELAIADRVTLLQAKKIEKNRGGQTWQDVVKLNRQQLSRLIAISDDAHYLFMLHSELGRGPLILPSRMVSDVLGAQTSPAIPLPIILRASKPLSPFLLHDIIGLWTGDTSQKLIESIRQGMDEGQGPRILIEVTLKHRQE